MRILRQCPRVLIVDKRQIAIHQLVNQRAPAFFACVPMPMGSQMRFLNVKRKSDAPQTHFRKNLEHRHLQTTNEILRAGRERSQVGAQSMLHVKRLFQFRFDVLFNASFGVRGEQLFRLLFFLGAMVLPHPLRRRLRARLHARAIELALQAMRQGDRHVERHTLERRRAMRDQTVHLQIGRHFAFGLDAVEQATQKYFLLSRIVFQNGQTGFVGFATTE